MSTSGHCLDKTEYFAAVKCFGNNVTGKARDKLAMLSLEKRIVRGAQCIIERPLVEDVSSL